MEETSEGIHRAGRKLGGNPWIQHLHESIGISNNPKGNAKHTFFTVREGGNDVDGDGDGDDVGDCACGLGRPSCSH